MSDTSRYISAMSPIPPDPAAADAAVDAAVDAALASYPVASLPPGFHMRAMARVTASAPPRPAVRPRLTFLDFALTLFGAVATLLVVVLALAATQQEPALDSRLVAWGQTAWATLMPGLPVPDAALLSLATVIFGVVALAGLVVLERVLPRRTSGVVRG
jgi:hypothetical protein